MKPLVLYHGNCYDGFCAAWIFKSVEKDAEFVPVQYGQEPPDCTDRDVYILDFSYKRGVMEKIIDQANSVTVLDHHKSAELELAGLGDLINRIIFDSSKSGARLTWEYFNKLYDVNLQSTWLVDYTEDRDLWRHKLPGTKAINAYLHSYPLDFALWDLFALTAPNSKMWHTMVNEGEAILRREQQIVHKAVESAYEIELDGHKILVTNATTMISEISGALDIDRPFGATYFIKENKQRIWSLRSAPDGIDVSEIARLHGGGGHRHAAGFEETL